jgi:hypothetical protein
MLNGMRNLYPAFFTVATVLVALVVAIAKEAGHLGQYGRGVPYLIAAILLCIALGVVCLISGKHQRDSVWPSPPSQSQIAEANPRQEQHVEQHVHIGRDLLQPPVAPVPLPQVAEPNIRFIPPVVTTKVATGIQDNTFFFERADGSDMIVAKFRNNVQGQGNIREPHIRAQIIYRNNAGDEITDVPAAIWLEERRRYTKFTSGDTKALILLAVTADRKVCELWKEHRNRQYSSTIELRSDEIVGIAEGIEVRLILENGGGCLGVYFFDVVEWNHRVLPIVALRD